MTIFIVLNDCGRPIGYYSSMDRAREVLWQKYQDYGYFDNDSETERNRYYDQLIEFDGIDGVGEIVEQEVED